MFLPLDDILEEGKHIDIEMSSRRGGHARRSSTGQFDTHVANGNVFGNGSYGNGGDEERGGLPAGGGDVPDISRPPMFLMEQDYGNSFKMSTCAVDQVGDVVGQAIRFSLATTFRGHLLWFGKSCQCFEQLNMVLNVRARKSHVSWLHGLFTNAPIPPPPLLTPPSSPPLSLPLPSPLPPPRPPP